MNIQFCTGNGQSDTHIHSGQPYQTKTLDDLLEMVREPASVDKDKAQWAILSNYHQFDARNHKAQKEYGSFVLLPVDLDEGAPQLDDVKRAVTEALGDVWHVIYSSRSATREKPKWRILFQPSCSVPGADYTAIQRALFDLLGQRGLVCDKALERPGQLVYLPNKGGHYEWDIHKGPTLSTDTGPLGERVSYNARMLEDYRKAGQEAAERPPRRPLGKDTDDDPMQWCNANFTLTDLLRDYGYEQEGNSDNWRSPHQTSGSYATKVYPDNRWVSLSGSDFNAGIGEKSADSGSCFGDAYDLYVHYEHKGDHKKAYLALRGMMPKTDPLADFNFNTPAIQDDKGGSSNENRLNSERAEQKDAELNIDEHRTAQKIKWIRLSEWADKPVKAREWTVDGWIPRGQVTLLYADGGVGKSQIILQLLTSICLGERWFGLGTAKGTALYLGAEDDLEELHRRYNDIIGAGLYRYEDFDDVVFTSLAGEDALLANYDPRSKIIRPSALMKEVTAAIEQHQPSICVIDTLADVFPADENDRALARQFISMLRKPAIENQCALVVLAHPSLSGMSTGRGTSGSTGWNNSVRSRITMERDQENPDRRILSLAKSNYSKIGTEISISWENGVFKHDPHSSGLDAKAANSKAQRVFLSLLESYNENGDYVNANGGTTYAPKRFAGSPGSEGVTKNAFTTAMKALLHEGMIRSEKTKRGTKLVVIKR